MEGKNITKPKKLRKMAVLTIALICTILGFDLSNIANATTEDTYIQPDSAVLGKN